MTWQDQGRQDHMWFGHGTAGSKDGSDPMFKPENLNKHIDAVAYGALLHLPRKEWHRQGNTTIRPGTAIATFDANGRCSGHAAICLGQDAVGIRVIDQWNIRDRNGAIVGQHTPSERPLWLNDPAHARIDRGEFYRVIE